MNGDRKKRILERLELRRVYLEKESDIDDAPDIFALAVAGGDKNLIEARNRIAALDAESRRALRLAVDRLDDLLDADAMDRRLAKRQPNGGRSG